ncbi:MAG: endonuclease [Bacteroidales bacterium]|nr:endonuclease [Bacteroidales bacterium]
MKNSKNITIILFLFFIFNLISFDSVKAQQEQYISKDYFRIMFYNVENLFDIYDDSLKNDDEFLPNGVKYWNWDKYNQKINNICKVIIAVGGWKPPDIIGLCEIENRYVLEGIVKYTPLSKLNYQIIHKESPDRRGIDVGLLYLEDRFTPIDYQAIAINFPNNPEKKTRDILYVKGFTKKQDTLHIFINHWPSRWGGQLESEPNRIIVASVLRNKIDSIINDNLNSNIIITGDMNDEPENESVINTLGANINYDNISNKQLYNLSFYLKDNKGLGSYKYQGEWGILDHIIVSGNLLMKEQPLYTSLEDVHIFKKDFLLEKDNTHFGYKTFRTYIGFKFNGGYSDHLPVYIDLKWE